SFELVVTPLPPQTENNSLYSEGTDGIRVLTTRYRKHPVKEDTREEVRKIEAQLKTLREDGQKMENDLAVLEQNLGVLTKLEGFTQANLQHETEKGTLNSEAVMALAKYVMETRAEKMDAQVKLRQTLADNKEQIQFAERQQQELAANSDKTEHEAIIVVDKKTPAPGKVRLNYLVNSASWRPQYKFRAGKDTEPIQLEYLAAITQQTGENWDNVDLTLSTAEPLLNSAPPELKMLDVAVVARAPGSGQGGANLPAQQMAAQPMASTYANPNPVEFEKQALTLRGEAQKAYTGNNVKGGGQLINDAAALEQAKDLLATKEEELKNKPMSTSGGTEGPSVTYHLGTKLAVPSRPDEQVIEVAKIEMKPEYCYKAVPVLTAHVYRLANLVNKSEYVLLPGEATMYIGSDFVGRTTLPLVAIGEQFTAGFGVDPQLQVQRQMIDKSRTTQGDNQVLRYEYRILVSSYKPEPVKMQVWDRLPHAETEAVSVSLVKAAPEVSTDGMYLREARPNNLLRWDLNVEPAMNGEKALAVNYEFKIELGRQMMFSNFLNFAPSMAPGY
ncbi:MAG: mucoidy inhibitor MuiA family protein, partial [Planctomycetes bacterium]|nr:mucoidy inhibitor MuiA family protein [Planctomycetota bacterium]